MADVLPVGHHFFDTEHLQHALTTAIPTIPDTKTGAIIAAVDTHGMTVGVTFTLHGGAWKVRGVVEKDWGGKVGAAGDVLFTW